MIPDSKKPITVEDLIRLKRAERPPAEFWAEFDRELRAKQLAALVQKHPWWQTLPGASFRALVRFRLPLGAAAVLAATFVSMRDAEAPAVAAPVSSIASVAAPLPAPTPIEARSVAGLGEAAEVAVSASVAVAVESTAPSVAIAEPAFSSTPVSTNEAPALPSFADLNTPSTEADFANSPLLAANLGAAGAGASPISTHLLGAHSGFESRVLPARAAVEPLQQMSSPGETRRARLLTAMVSMASLEASARTTARAASRIEEEDLYDQVQRFGARGDRLHVKF